MCNVSQYIDLLFILVADLCLPMSEVQAMLMSVSYYRRGTHAARDKRPELQRRLASVSNELAVRYMNDAQRE